MTSRSRMSNSKRGHQDGGPGEQRALVEWLDGAYAGSYTHDVHTDWILNFEAMSPALPETYAIEWRVPPKPRNGWPLYNGRVLDVSCKCFGSTSVCTCLGQGCVQP